MVDDAEEVIGRRLLSPEEPHSGVGDPQELHQRVVTAALRRRPDGQRRRMGRSGRSGTGPGSCPEGGRRWIQSGVRNGICTEFTMTLMIAGSTSVYERLGEVLCGVRAMGRSMLKVGKEGAMLVKNVMNWMGEAYGMIFTLGRARGILFITRTVVGRGGGVITSAARFETNCRRA